MFGRAQNDEFRAQVTASLTALIERIGGIADRLDATVAELAGLRDRVDRLEERASHLDGLQGDIARLIQASDDGERLWLRIERIERQAEVDRGEARALAAALLEQRGASAGDR